MPRKTKGSSAQTCVFIAAIVFCCAFFPLSGQADTTKLAKRDGEVATYIDSKLAYVDFRFHVNVKSQSDPGKNSIFLKKIHTTLRFFLRLKLLFFEKCCGLKRIFM